MDDDPISLAHERADNFARRALDAVHRDLARRLDVELAPLVAAGGELARQRCPTLGVDRYYVGGRLRLEVGPVKSERDGTSVTVSLPIKRFP